MTSMPRPDVQSPPPPSPLEANQSQTLAVPLAALRNVGRWFSALPLWAQVAIWCVLAVVFAGWNILPLYGPVVIVLWLWETTRPLVRQRSSTNTGHKRAAPATTLDFGRWLRHVAEMVVAMYAGMLVYMALVRPVVKGIGPARLVTGDLSYAWMMLFMLAPMAALMRFLGHSWRMTGEMAAGMVVPVLVCFGLGRLGICPLVPFLTWLTPRNLYEVAHDGMLLGMMAVMVFWRGMYAHTHIHGAMASTRVATYGEALAVRAEPPHEGAQAESPKAVVPTS